MTEIVIVASKRDAPFAESIRAGLMSSKQRDVSVSESLPQLSDAYVVLLWSAALEASHAIDIQALIALWSDGRLLVVRRDATPLPLGMRDLASLTPDKTPSEICAAVGEATESAVAKFSPAMPQSKPAERRRDTPAFSREESRSRPASDARGKSSRVARFSAAFLIVVFAGGGAYYYLTAAQRAMQAELTARLETAAKTFADLKQAQTKQLEALKEVEARRVAEAAALKSGDAAKIREAQEATKRAEAEAAKQAELVKQRETASTKAREDAKKAADAAKQAAADKAKTTEKVEVAAVAPKVEAPRVETPKAAQPAQPAPQAQAPQPVAKEAPKALTRSQREAQRDAEAAAKAIGKPSEQVAALSPSVAAPSGAATPGAAAPTAPAAPAAKAGVSDSEAMFQQALAMERDGKAADAVRIYRRAARAGHGKAAKRLGDIFDRGVPGVSRDYAESLQWYQTARDLGESVEVAGRRDPSGVPELAAKSRPIPKAAEPETVAAAEKPAPPPSAPAAVPPSSAPESGTPYGVAILVAIIILAFGIVLWRRSRRIAQQIASQPQSTGRAAAQAPVDAATLFVSYSHKDKKRVEPIVSLMEEMGRRVWMDRTDITGQAGWAGQIVRAIRECRAVVLMASPNSFSSDQVVRELYLAMNHKKTIVPIEIEPAELPDELQYILAPFQHHRLSGSETREVLGRALAAV